MEPSTSSAVNPSARCRSHADRQMPALTPMSNTLRSPPRRERVGPQRVPVKRPINRSRRPQRQVLDLDVTEVLVVGPFPVGGQGDAHVSGAAGIGWIVDVAGLLDAR